MYNKEYYQKNREKMIAAAKKYQEDNYEKVLIYRKFRYHEMTNALKKVKEMEKLLK